MPSRRSVLTCKPSLPGGRFSGALPPCRPSKYSKGSRRPCLACLPAAAGAVPGGEGFSPALAARFLGAFPPAFAVGFAAGLAGALPAGLVACGACLAVGAADLAACGAGLAVCAAGLAAAGAAGLAGCCAGLPAPCVGFALLGVDGSACARTPGVAAAIQIPSPRVITERIVRSFPLRVSQPHQLQAWLRLREPP